jgi:hypothetical protein
MKQRSTGFWDTIDTIDRCFSRSTSVLKCIISYPHTMVGLQFSSVSNCYGPIYRQAVFYLGVEKLMGFCFFPQINWFLLVKSAKIHPQNPRSSGYTARCFPWEILLTLPRPGSRPRRRLGAGHGCEACASGGPKGRRTEDPHGEHFHFGKAINNPQF